MKIVCSYFCKDDDESSRPENVYCRLLSQLLNQKPVLKRCFKEWYDRTQAHLGRDPTRLPGPLSKFLTEMIGSVRSPVFLVIDGLDKCPSDRRRQILTLLESLRQPNPSQPKVLLSYRLDEEIKRCMPEGSAAIKFHTTRSRDELIVRYWVAQSLRNLDKQVQEVIVDNLSEHANGCAIWVRLVVECLYNTGATKLEAIRKELQDMPPPRRLTELYANHFRRLLEAKSTTKKSSP